MAPTLIAALGLITLLVVPDSRAAGQDLAFDTIQSECVRAGTESTAALARSASCQVTKGRWYSTIEHADLYQAQYCLRDTADAKTCQQRGLLLFANRAYTPTAQLTLERIDPAGTEYDDPQVYATASGYVLKLTARSAPGAAQTNYFRWQNETWQALDTASWQAAVSGLLAPGQRPGELPPPDIEAMHSRVEVYREDDAPCCAGAVAEIDFEWSGNRLAIKSLQTLVP